ncbi:MAG: M42 family metallopeptidase [Anaerolineae bacterium]
MTTELKELLKRLSAAVGVTGYETAAGDILAEELRPYVDEIQRDRLGSLTALKRGEPPAGAGPRRKMMLAAHLDEIGAMVTEVNQGFLRFTQVGGLDARVLMGQEVTVHGRQDLPGVIASRPPHLAGAEDRDKLPPLAEMFIDVGLPPEEVESQVRVGDPVSFAGNPAELLGGVLCGKAFDNRASVAAMVVCLQHLARLKHEWDVYAVGTVQEEWGNFAGATTRAYELAPDAAVALDVTFASAPGIADDVEVELNKGPVLAIGPNLHPVLVQRLRQTADQLEMATQLEPSPGHTGTDAWPIQVSRAGVPTALVGVPLRYMHSPVEVIQPRDVERVGRLLAHFIAGLDETFIEDLTPKDGLEADHNGAKE